MLDKKAYKLLDLFYRKDRLTFDEIQSETHEEEKASSSLCVSALCSEKFISTWESSVILTRAIFGSTQRAKRPLFLSHQLLKLSSHLLELVQLLLRDFPALHQLFDLCFWIPLKAVLELPEPLYHVLELPHRAGQLSASDRIKQWIHCPHPSSFVV